jgi:hypothetical protein
LKESKLISRVPKASDAQMMGVPASHWASFRVHLQGMNIYVASMQLHHGKAAWQGAGERPVKAQKGIHLRSKPLLHTRQTLPGSTCVYCRELSTYLDAEFHYILVSEASWH